MTRLSTNTARRTLNGPGGRTTEGQFGAIASQASPPAMQRAVVLDVITDVNILSEEYLNNIAETVNNPQLVDVMPINSVIARVVGSGAGTTAGTNTILFPLFSSHIMLPIKPGEQIYFFYEDYEATGNKIGYWLSRPTSIGTVEDANYTHYDRMFDPTINPNNYGTATQTKKPQNQEPYGFPNGGNTEESKTLSSENLGPDQNPFDQIVKAAKASEYFNFEPVPRWKKRPGELILQGSHNSLIMLGKDRNGALQSDSDASPSDAGAIDLVAGRGRYKLNPGQQPVNGEKTQTSALIAESRRQDGTSGTETDKAPFRASSLPDKGNVNEGNPNPKWDAARIYIAQQSNVDENYGISTADYPSQAIAPEQPTGNPGTAYVLAKADNIRVIARKDEDVNGTIFIGKEGDPNTSNIGSVPATAAVRSNAGDPNGDLAYLFINSEGQIQIEGNKIVLGRGNDNKEPYIRYSYYKVQIEELKTQVKALADLVQNMGTVYDAAFSTAVAIPFAPIASLFAIGSGGSNFNTSQVIPTVTNIKLKVDTINPEDTRSTKIFGE